MKRLLHPEQWLPSEKDRFRLISYFKRYYEGIKMTCGAEDENTHEALALYQYILHTPIQESKETIQRHFAFMFDCVNGKPEKYYDDANLLSLIHLTVSPDPVKEE